MCPILLLNLITLNILNNIIKYKIIKKKIGKRFGENYKLKWSLSGSLTVIYVKYQIGQAFEAQQTFGFKKLKSNEAFMHTESLVIMWKGAFYFETQPHVPS